MRDRFAVVGVDFGGPSKLRDQRRKIVAVEAVRVAPRRYSVVPGPFNARLFEAAPGWTAAELAAALIGHTRRLAVGFDFPFSIPARLLEDAAFAAEAGAPGPLRTWAAFNRFVAGRVDLDRDVDLTPFAGWRSKRNWLRRSTDVPARAQPALKDRFQVLFNMTLVGAAFLARLARSGRFDVLPFQRRGREPVLEVYPGHAMTALGIRGYKSHPGRAIGAALRRLAEAGVSLEVDASIRARCVQYSSGGNGTPDHDAADALAACAVTILAVEGLAVELRGESPDAWRVEGAIWSVGPDRTSRREARRAARVAARGVAGSLSRPST